LTVLPHADLSAAAAAAAPAAVRSKQDAADIARVEKYLNNLRTMTARFLQSAADGSTAEGTLYLSRPGRLRLEYDPPTPVLVVSDGRLVHYYDSELKQVSTVRLSDTPAAVLVRETYDFSKDVRITALERGPGVLRVTLQDVNNPETGQLTLTFQENPFVLKQWRVVDAQGQVTTVALSDSRRDVALAPDLFEFVDPTKPRAPFGN
jgi:outer membrane lipoprotein-sorting protein